MIIVEFRGKLEANKTSNMRPMPFLLNDALLAKLPFCVCVYAFTIS